MASSEIAVSTTPPLPGTVLVQQINDAFEAVATQFSGAVDPAAYADAYMLWADTGTGNVKRRNAANSAWDIVGRIVPTVVETASGNVGIGTSSPNSRLDSATSASGSIATSIRATNSAAASGSAGQGSQIGFANDNDWGSNLASAVRSQVTNPGNGSSALSFLTWNGSVLSECGRFDSSGNLLVGVTSSGFSNTTSLVLDKAGGYLIVNHSGTAGGTGYALFGYNGTGIGSITQNGTTAVSFNTASDYRLKENVAPMQNALATVAALKPCTYTWKADGSAGQGFIAHELQAVVPDCVTGEKDAIETVDELDDEGNKIGTKEVPRYQGVDTSFLVATLVAAIQELKADFDAYKAAHP